MPVLDHFHSMLALWIYAHRLPPNVVLDHVQFTVRPIAIPATAVTLPKLVRWHATAVPIRPHLCNQLLKFFVRHCSFMWNKRFLGVFSFFVFFGGSVFGFLRNDRGKILGLKKPFGARCPNLFGGKARVIPARFGWLHWLAGEPHSSARGAMVLVIRAAAVRTAGIESNGQFESCAT
jgi:hypothetical protein